MTMSSQKQGMLYAPTPRLPPSSSSLNTMLSEDQNLSPSSSRSLSSSPMNVTAAKSGSASIDHPQPPLSSVGRYSSNPLRSSSHSFSYSPSPSAARAPTLNSPSETTISNALAYTDIPLQQLDDHPDSLSNSSGSNTSFDESLQVLSPISKVFKSIIRFLCLLVPPFRSRRRIFNKKDSRGHGRGHRRRYSLSSRGSIYGGGFPDAIILVVFIIACFMFIGALCGFGLVDEETMEQILASQNGMNKSGIKSNSYLYMHVDPDGYVSHPIPQAHASVEFKNQQGFFTDSVREVPSPPSDGNAYDYENADDGGVYYTSTEFSPNLDSRVADDLDRSDEPVPPASGEDTIPDPTPVPLPSSKISLHDKYRKANHHRLASGNNRANEASSI